MESDTMGAKRSIRRLADPNAKDASIQRFVIHAADASRALILANQPSEVELVFPWIEYVDSMPERICLTISLLS